MADSLTETTLSFKYGLTFPLAATLGILAIIAPGGIGVREGVLFLFLNSSGALTVEEATTISVFSRVWFLVGESFLFLIALLMSKMD
jgi:uncharacterized membrane protein YbhN (UPF0104 family)